LGTEKRLRDAAHAQSSRRQGLALVLRLHVFHATKLMRGHDVYHSGPAVAVLRWMVPKDVFLKVTWPFKFGDIIA